MKQIRTFFLGENLVMFDLQDVVKIKVNGKNATFTLKSKSTLNTDKFDASLLNTIKTVYISDNTTYVNAKSIVGYSAEEMVDVLGNKYVITEDESEQITDIVADAETLTFWNYTFIKENVSILNGAEKKVNGVTINLYKPVPPQPPVVLDFKGLCLTAEEAGSTIKLERGGEDCNYFVSINGAEWQPYNLNETITLTKKGDFVYWKGNGFYGTEYGYGYRMTGKIAASGSVMSLIDEVGESTDMAGNNFKSLFNSCTSLTTAPELPATTLTSNCYFNMFYGCSNLTTAPELPATTLEDGCYQYMFYGCTSLTKSPKLFATTLTNSCYMKMFKGCSNLNYISVGSASWNQWYCEDWVDGVSATGTFVKPASTPINTGSDGIPYGWTVENV